MTATAASGAQPTSTPLFVEQLATTNQVAFQDPPAVPAGPGSMSVQLANGTSFNVDLASVPTATATARCRRLLRSPEVINTAASGNATAMVVTVGGATATGADLRGQRRGRQAGRSTPRACPVR